MYIEISIVVIFLIYLSGILLRINIFSPWNALLVFHILPIILTCNSVFRYLNIFYPSLHSSHVAGVLSIKLSVTFIVRNMTLVIMYKFTRRLYLCANQTNDYSKYIFTHLSVIWWTWMLNQITYQKRKSYQLCEIVGFFCTFEALFLVINRPLKYFTL